jgi:hypothetical protein
MPSRRQVLAGVGVAGLGAVAGGWSTRLGPVATESPPSNTWPQTRRDAANTASTDDQSPTDPSAAWEESAVADGTYGTLVADRETVYVGGSAIAAHDRTSGANRWRVRAPGELLALRDDTLFTATSRGTDGGPSTRTLRAYDVTAGTKRWQADLPSVAYGLTPTVDGIFVGCHGSLTAFGLDGRHRWTLESSGSGIVRPMVYDGALFAATAGTVSRFQSRRLLDLPVHGPPEPAWTGSDVYGGYPTVLERQLVIGNEQSQVDVGDPGVTAFHLDSGEFVWSSVDGPSADERERIRALTPAKLGGPGAPHPRAAITAVSRSDGSASTDSILGIDLRNGGIRWRRDVEPLVSSVAGVPGGAVVATDSGTTEAGGSIRAYSTAGEPRWVVEFDRAVTAIAPLAGELLALLRDGRVVSLQ